MLSYTPPKFGISFITLRVNIIPKKKKSTVILKTPQILEDYFVKKFLAVKTRFILIVRLTRLTKKY